MAFTMETGDCKFILTDEEAKGAAEKLGDVIYDHSRIGRIAKDTSQIKRTTSQIADMLASGDGHTYPWHRLHPVRRLQVEAVRDRLRDNKAHNILQAAIQVFTLVQNGYKSATALAKYCYAIDIFRYV